MKLNLGCGRDIKQGYTNVDLHMPCDRQEDLSKIPWNFADESADEILMLDFLEHFPYASTNNILHEVWRVLKKDGFVDIQVPDFEHCAKAAMATTDMSFQCNACGWWFDAGRSVTTDSCMKCGQSLASIQSAAIHRLYGGQNVIGNWHFTAFTAEILTTMLIENGFNNFELLEYEHQHANWNFKIRAFKNADSAWGDNG